jgi:hypothetical protein
MICQEKFALKWLADYNQMFETNSHMIELLCMLC